MQTELNASVLADLQAAATSAHERYSSAHAKHVEAETELGKAGAIRSRLVKGLDESRRTLSDARRAAIGAAISREGFSEASAKVLALQGEAFLLDLALRRYHAFQYSDAVRESLTAKVNALEAQHRSETARLEHLTAKIQLEISAVAGRNGGSLEIDMTSATAGHRELCSRIRRDADGTREELKAATAEALALRNGFEKEK